jgi:hypothetical protein
MNSASLPQFTVHYSPLFRTCYRSIYLGDLAHVYLGIDRYQVLPSLLEATHPRFHPSHPAVLYYSVLKNTFSKLISKHKALLQTNGVI